jgi:subtilisin family serine protease
MGGDALEIEPVFRCGMPHRLRCDQFVIEPSGRHELLIEPKAGVKPKNTHEILKQEFPSTEIIAELRNFLWIAVHHSELEKALASNREDRLVSLSHRLQHGGVKRVWPNVFLYTQQILSGSPTPYLSAARANPKRNDGAGIVWALIDTDVRDSHDDLKGAIADRVEVSLIGSGKPLVTAASGKYPRPGPGYCDHGTHLAGIIHKIAPAAQIVSVALPVMNLTRYPEGFRLRDVAHLEQALDWVATRPDIHGVNVSLGQSPDAQDPLVGVGPGCKGIDDCVKAQKVVVVAAGNHGRQHGKSGFFEVSITDPANAYAAIVVGACGSEDPDTQGIWSGSSHGPTADGREKPDLVAPGIDILSSGGQRDSDRRAQSGTSQAAAIVSGALAAAMSRATGVPTTAWRSRLQSSCRDLGRQRTYQGAGVIQIDTLLNLP